MKMKKKTVARWILQASNEELFRIDHQLYSTSFKAGELRDGSKSGYYILVECEDGEIYAEMEADDKNMWEDLTLSPLFERLRDIASEIVESEQ